MPSRPLGLILVTLCPQLPAAASFHPSARALARGASPGCGPARDQSWQGSGKEASRLPPPGGSSAEAAAFMSLAGPQAGCCCLEAAWGLPMFLG